jgi:hypothetical protein
MKIIEAIFLPGLVLLPRHTIYSWSSLALQCVETVPKRIGRDIVKQSSELFSLPSDEVGLGKTIEARILSDQHQALVSDLVDCQVSVGR